MQTYRIRKNHKTLTTIEADSIEDAADRYVRSIHGDYPFPKRTTGDRGRSGYFQVYAPVRYQSSQYRSLDADFHVSLD